MRIRSLGDLAARFSRPVITRALQPVGARVVSQTRSAVVEIGGAVARQVDETTCGSAALVMLAASGDPVLMDWLETGALPADADLPPEIPADWIGKPSTAAERFAAAQLHVKNLTNRRALGLFPWPKSLGTPPWAAAKIARFPGVRYVSRAVDDRGEAGAAMVAQVSNAVRSGYPVLLYVGGTLQRLTTALPRHIVLAVPSLGTSVTQDGEPLISIYEPSSGRVWEIPVGELSDRSEPAPQFGHWSHIQWIVVPVPQGESHQ